MAKPIKEVTPPGRVEAWKKLWSTPRKLTDEEAEATFEEFETALVPTHMQRRFEKTFGVPKAAFGNRFFSEGASFHGWETRLTSLGAEEGSMVEATILYASPDEVEGHTFKGQSRRTIKDLFVDDWQAACAIVRSDRITLYLFVEPKMRGCIALAV